MSLPDLSGRNICILATHGFEESELIQPRDDLKGAGANVTIVSPESGARVEQYDALVLPGGQINPDLLRVEDEALALIKAFADAGKPVAAVCHAPWLLIEAGLVEGKTLTCYKSIVTDLKNAGANYVDQEVAVDGNLITSRCPDDLPAFGKAIAEMVSEKASAEMA
jgi:protease I